MKITEAINLLIQTFGKKIEIISIGGSNVIWVENDVKRMFEVRDARVSEIVNGKFVETDASRWRENVLKGHKRDDAGNFVAR